MKTVWNTDRGPFPINHPSTGTIKVIIRNNVIATSHLASQVSLRRPSHRESSVAPSNVKSWETHGNSTDRSVLGARWASVINCIQVATSCKAGIGHAEQQRRKQHSVVLGHYSKRGILMFELTQTSARGIPKRASGFSLLNRTAKMCILWARGRPHTRGPCLFVHAVLLFIFFVFFWFFCIPFFVFSFVSLSKDSCNKFVSSSHQLSANATLARCHQTSEVLTKHHATWGEEKVDVSWSPKIAISCMQKRQQHAENRTSKTGTY